MAPPDSSNLIEQRKQKEAIDRLVELKFSSMQAGNGVANANVNAPKNSLVGHSALSVPADIEQTISKKLKTLQEEHGKLKMEQFASTDPISSLLKNCIVNTSKLPSVKWDDIGGLDLAKTALKANVILPTMQPQACQNHSSKILLYGPPGCGKTMLIKALATEMPNITLIHTKSSDLLSKYLGESEK